MSIGDVVEQLDVVLDKIEATRTSLTRAAASMDEATETFGAAVSGTTAPDALLALAYFEAAEPDIRSSLAVLKAVEDSLRAYRTHVVGESSPPSDTPDPRANRSRSTDTAAVPDPVTPERVEELRRELPPPVLSSTGQKTHGRWIDPDGNVHREMSGKDRNSEMALRFFEEIRARRIPVTVVDVEIKLAIHMRNNDIRSTTLVLNNLPCRGPLGCNALIPVILPPGYTMTVYGPNGFRQTYEGGGSSKWVP